ncbi:MAG: hypothetical protein WBL65_06395 [Bryobacteraceae bacterium]
MRRQSLLTLAAAFAVALVNVALVTPLFQVEYTDQMGSIEAAYISLARYTLDHFPDLQWFPLWYTGTPYQTAYTPLLPMSVAALAAVARITPSLAYHALTAAFYCLGPVALFWLVHRLSGSRTQALFAGLAWSLFSPSYFLIPEVHHDAEHLFHGVRRLQVLLEYGEGPHIVSMTLLLAALICLDAAVRKGGVWRWLLCSAALAATVLCDWIGGFALAVFALCYLLARGRGWLRAAGAGGYAYLLASPWIPPSTIAVIAVNAQLLGGQFITPNHWLYAALFALALAALVWALGRARAPLEIRFAVLLAASFTGMVIPWYWWHIAVMPQPSRYQLEFDLAICLLGAAVGERLSRFLPPRLRLVLGSALAFACVPYTLDLREVTLPAVKAIDIHRTIEWRTAHWADGHLAGARVYAPGSIAFWFNAFTDVAQLSGGIDQGDIQRVGPAVRYQILTGPDGAVARDWLRIYGCDAVIVSGPESEEQFKDFIYPRKFDGVLPVLWRENDVTIYAVPRRSRSLAHVVFQADLARRFPPDAGRPAELQPFLAALEDPGLPLATFQWLGTRHARIAAYLRPGYLIAVQVAYHRGWSARVNGQARRVWGDPLGLMIVDPRCDGPCVVDLAYDGGTEMTILRVLSLLCILSGAGGLAAGVLVRRCLL